VAPVMLVVAAFLAYAVLPVGRNMVAVDLEAGLLFFFAAGATTEVTVFMAGWSSRNKYSMLGAMRAMAQMISYELPLILATVPVIMLVGSLSTTAAVAAQEGYWGWIPRWHVFTPWGLSSFFLFLVAAAAESNRSPFDLPEGESEIVAGYFVEYSGFKFALFFLGEYLGLFAVSGMAITLFLGGWHAPMEVLTWVPSYAWFFAKLLVLIGFFIWVRGTVPRLRMDQLMNLAWKFMLPLALWNLPVAALWHYTASWQSGAGGLVRWLACALLVAWPFVALSRVLFGRHHSARRQYRFGT
jgi:NADH-quinone oxidoreductase subunit H